MTSCEGLIILHTHTFPQNENKELQTTQKRTTMAWDEKYATLLGKLEGYQEEKDTPKKEIVDMEMEELYV